MVGLRDLSMKMAKPCGDDAEDFSVMHCCNFACRISFRILASKPAAPLDCDEEEKLALGCATVLGNTWTWNASHLWKDKLEKDENSDHEA